MISVIRLRINAESSTHNTLIFCTAIMPPAGPPQGRHAPPRGAANECERGGGSLRLLYRLGAVDRARATRGRAEQFDARLGRRRAEQFDITALPRRTSMTGRPRFGHLFGKGLLALGD